ncbi:heme/hemin ABC transporter substrate-binding protein [Thalassospira xiamenensis]|uniref:heme/hemin ABC transporter substrate-binding protein n=1 Tax=Thalassospira xiamenensis TaxID=220697 RepID=UPI000AFE9656|nr:ABC transporter substrate-binding protein [Thalassospira xiamenensis]MCK2167202.1 ABC transporter substrate-binding protein [Thalassospira xiamenensis]
MKQLIRLGLICTMLTLSGNVFAQVQENPRVVTIGGSLTEIVYALGRGDHLVGVDLTSSWPPEVEKLPKVGLYKSISSEGVLSLVPTHVLAYSNTEPASAMQQISSADVFVTIFERNPPQKALFDNILKVGKILTAEQQAQNLVREIREDLEHLEKKVASFPNRPRVLFLLNYDPSQMMVAGKGTVVDYLIDLAGGVNVAEAIDGYKPINAELVTSLVPDVVLSVEERWEDLGAREQMQELPGLIDTPAGRNNRFVALPGALVLGLGPRIAEAVELLAAAIHGPHGSDL